MTTAIKTLIAVAAFALAIGNAQADHPAALIGKWHDSRATYTFRTDGTVTMDKHVYKVNERWDVEGDILTWGSATYRLLVVNPHQVVYQDLDNGYAATMTR
jgi:hypothetical protein